MHNKKQKFSINKNMRLFVNINQKIDKMCFQLISDYGVQLGSITVFIVAIIRTCFVAPKFFWPFILFWQKLNLFIIREVYLLWKSFHN